jgi:hypothetical protein
MFDAVLAARLDADDVDRLLQRVERQRADAGHDIRLHQRIRRPADVVIRGDVGAVVDAGENALGLLVVGVAGRRLRADDVVAVRRGDRRVERHVGAVRVARGDRRRRLDRLRGAVEDGDIHARVLSPCR